MQRGLGAACALVVMAAGPAVCFVAGPHGATGAHLQTPGGGAVQMQAARDEPRMASAPRRAVLLAGGLALGHLAAGAPPALAFENRKQGVELFPQLKGVPYGANTPVPAGVGLGAELRGCPSTEGTARPPPNCFSSVAPRPGGGDQLYYAEPFTYKGKDAKQAMQELLAVAVAYPPGQGNIDAGGWKIVKQTSTYLYVQFESGKIGYLDDLEFLLDEANNKVLVRSASRTGFLDFAVNAKRINWFASALDSKGGWSTALITPGNHPDYFKLNGDE